MFNPGDVVVIDFPGVTGVKRRPTVVVSSAVYHASRPDVVVGLITSQTAALCATDYVWQDWAQVGLQVPSVFRSFFATLSPVTHSVLVGHLSDRDWQGEGTLLLAFAIPFPPGPTRLRWWLCDSMNFGGTPRFSYLNFYFGLLALIVGILTGAVK